MEHTGAMFGLAIGLFFGMLALLELGRRIGQRRSRVEHDGARAGVAVADGAMFALLGLLIAFSFSGAAARFQQRRELITDETNAIGTAWLRLDLLPADAQPMARASMRHYVDARLAVYGAMHDRAAVVEALQRVAERQAELWSVAVAAVTGRDPSAEMLVMPALNAMFDIGARRTHALDWHPPTVVFVLLCILALGCAFLAGFDMAGASHRPLLHMLAFAAVLAATVYITVDLEHPRQGLLRVEDDDQLLIAARAAMD